MSASGKRLLAVSWEMPPLAGPRAVQVPRTLAALVRNGWTSTVICVEPRPGGPLLRDAPGAGVFAAAGVDLLRVPSPEEETWRRAAFRLWPRLGRMPDRQRVWIGAATRAASRRLDEGGVNLIVSFAQPWSDHLIGLHLHLTHRLPWVAHFSDPWVDSPYLNGPAWMRARWTRMEADVVREADALVFVTEQTADVVMRKYPDDWRRKVHVVPQGYDRAQVEHLVAEPRGQKPRLRLVYTGRFYEGLRTPGPLLEAIVRLRARGSLRDEIELLLIGPQMSAYEARVWDLGLESVVSVGGRRPYVDALRVAASADVLLVIDAPSRTPSLFLPSKLVDYLMLRKPILGLTPSAGASADLLRRLGCPIAAPDDVDGIARALEDLIAAWHGGRLLVSDAFDAVAAEFDIERTTARLARVLDQCV
jgi:glycosyltransferase involved in cell wall biosynthesis